MQCELSVLVKLQAAFQISRTGQGLKQLQTASTAKLQRTGHEPVCLVPEYLDKHLPVPDCTFPKEP